MTTNHWSFPKACLPRDYLLQNSLDVLEAEYKVRYKRHPMYPNLVQLRYDQIESDLRNPLVQQCRGIILDEDDKWSVIAWPFDKFFNHGEAGAANINWGSATVQEKVDGTLMILYNYDRLWHVATLGMPDAGGQINGLDYTFAELFWETWGVKGFDYPTYVNEKHTFMFELTSPFNRVVVRHDRADLKLLGIRSVYGTETPVRYYNYFNPVKEFRLGSLAKVLETFEKMDPLQQEGYVVVDGCFNRVKVKHPGYVAMHHMKEGFGVKRILEVIRNAESSEVVNAFPEWGDAFEQVKAAYDGIAIVLEQYWDELKGIKVRKDFAERAGRTPIPAILFMMLDGKISSPKEGLKMMHIDKLVDVLGVKGIQLIGSGL